MSSEKHTQFTRVTVDTLVCSEPCLLYGVHNLPSANAGNSRIYDGHDAASGNLVLTVKGLANISWQIHFDPPILLSRGLFVDIVTNITECTVFWQALE